MLKTLRISERMKNVCSPGTCILVRGKGDERGTGYKTALTYKWWRTLEDKKNYKEKQK